MAKVDPEMFRLRFRLEMAERLSLLTAFQNPLLSGALTVDQSQRNLEEWLDTNGANIDRELGALFGEPAQTALYADEAREALNRMKRLVAMFADVARRSGQWD